MEGQFFYTNLPGIPRKAKWPVRMHIKQLDTAGDSGGWCKVYSRSDQSYFTVKVDKMEKFPDSKTFERGLAFFKKKPSTLKSFMDDVEWANSHDHGDSHGGHGHDLRHSGNSGHSDDSGHTCSHGDIGVPTSASSSMFKDKKKDHQSPDEDSDHGMDDDSEHSPGDCGVPASAAPSIFKDKQKDHQSPGEDSDHGMDDDSEHSPGDCGVPESAASSIFKDKQKDHHSPDEDSDHGMDDDSEHSPGDCGVPTSAASSIFKDKQKASMSVDELFEESYDDDSDISEYVPDSSDSEKRKRSVRNDGKSEKRKQSVRNDSKGEKRQQSLCNDNERENRKRSVPQNDGIPDIIEKKQRQFSKIYDVKDENRLKDAANDNMYTRKLAGENTTGAKWNQAHACKFCKDIKTNISKHLKKHKTEKEIKQLEKMTKEHGIKSKMVQATWDLLRNEGDHLHNLKVLSDGSGELIVGRRQHKSFNVAEYGPCPSCHVWIKLHKTLYRHQPICPAKVLGLADCTTKTARELRIESLTISEKINPTASRILREEVYSIMTKDNISEVAQNDRLIVSLGNAWMLKNVGNVLKRKYYTSSRMRDAARLLINLRIISGLDDHEMTDFLTPQNFDTVVKGALKTASPNFDDIGDLQSPSTAIRLGYDIKRMIGAKWSMAIKGKDCEGRTASKDVMKLMTMEWSLRVTKMASITLQVRHFNKENCLPDPTDLVNLQTHVKNDLKKLDLSKPCPKTYRRAIELAETRLLLYNKRRSGEVEGICVKDYVKRQTGVTEVEQSMRAELSELEVHLLNTQDLLEVRGKNGRGVPVIIPMDVMPALAYLADAVTRNNSEILPSNHFLFPNTRAGVCRAYDVLKKLCKEVNLRRPEKITSVNMRKYTATISQVFDLSSQQQQWLVNHLGHSLDVHKIHYRQTSGVIERVDIAKLMLLQEFNIAGNYAGKRLEDVQLTELVFGSEVGIALDSEAGMSAASDTIVDEQEGPGSLDLEDSCDDVDYQPCLEDVPDFDEYDFEGEDEDVPKKKSKPATARVPWTAQERQELNTYFAENIKTFTTPGKEECVKAITNSRKNKGQLHRRGWETLKKKVWNVLQKKKRAL